MEGRREGEVSMNMDEVSKMGGKFDLECVNRIMVVGWWWMVDGGWLFGSRIIE
jgi:hypothetical protein